MINRIFDKLEHKDTKRLFLNFLSLFSLQGLNFLLPLLTMPYLFNVLGVEKFGLISFSLSVVTFLNVLVSYGFNLSATRDISLHRNNKKKLNEIFNNTMSAKLFLLLLSFIILSIMIGMIDKLLNNWLLFYASFILVVGNAIFPVWFFQGIEEMKYIGYFNFIAKLFFTVGIFLFVKSSDDYLIQPLFSGIGIVLVGVYSLYFIKKKYQIKFTQQPLSIILHTLKSSWNIFLSELMPNLYNNFAMFLLGFITTMENLGYYSLATQIINIFNSVIYIIRNVTFPYLSQNFNKFKIVSRTTIGIGIIFSIIIFSLSNFFVPFIFGGKATNSLELIYILAFSPLFLSISISYGSNKLLILNKDKEYRNITFQFSLFGFIVTLLMIPSFGIYGAGISLIITRLVMAYLIYQTSKGLE